jgi:hypothetical protein
MQLPLHPLHPLPGTSRDATNRVAESVNVSDIVHFPRSKNSLNPLEVDRR